MIDGLKPEVRTSGPRLASKTWDRAIPPAVKKRADSKKFALAAHQDAGKVHSTL
jgi:hypothetical protein